MSRTRKGISLIAMTVATALGFTFTVGVGVLFDAGSGQGNTVSTARLQHDAAPRSPTEVAISPARIDVVGVRDKATTRVAGDALVASRSMPGRPVQARSETDAAPHEVLASREIVPAGFFPRFSLRKPPS
jgi:hypothetical protein